MAASRTKFAKSQEEVFEILGETGSRVFTRPELAKLLERHRSSWDLPASMTFGRFTELLISTGRVRYFELESSYGKHAPRFLLGDPSIFAIALSLRKGAYLSHGTAVFLHNLTEQLPRVIYVNKEQSPKPRPTSPLTQAAIDRAFANNQRRSQLSYRFDGYEIVLVSGMNTANFEVSEVPGRGGERLATTKLERTLVDIAVRPSYAGGVAGVLEAYRRAASRLSLNTLVAVIKKLGYIYPYHQAIGFYLKRSGLPEARLAKLKDLGLHFDFYLSYGLKATQYDEEWRLRFPQGLELSDQPENEVEVEVERR